MVALNIETLLAWVVHRPPYPQCARFQARRHRPICRTQPRKQEHSSKQKEEEDQYQQELNKQLQEEEPQLAAGNGMTAAAAAAAISGAFEGEGSSPTSEVPSPSPVAPMPSPSYLPEALESESTGFEVSTMTSSMGGPENPKLKKAQRREVEGGEVEEEREEKEKEAWTREERRWQQQRRALDHLAQATHLHLQNKSISSIESDVSLCRGATVIFLQHNHLSRLNLPVLPSLRHLYLQHNNIVRLEGLDRQPRLLKLLASGNRISVLEGLAPPLGYLAVDHQRIPPGDAFVLDPQALLAVQATLTLLDISGNQLTEIGAVGLLTNLQVLRACDNNLGATEHIAKVVERLGVLQELDLRGNPVVRHRMYLPHLLLVATSTLVTLDGRAISQVMRRFVKNTETSRKKLVSRMFIPRAAGEVSTQKELDGILGATKQNLLMSAQQHPSALHGVAADGPRYILGSLRRPEFDMILNSALKADKNDQQENDDSTRAGTSSAESEIRLIPRPFWRHKSTPLSATKLSLAQRSTPA